MEKTREEKIGMVLGVCRHFTGLSGFTAQPGEVCAAGVNYQAVGEIVKLSQPPFQLLAVPCYRDYSWLGLPVVCNCVCPLREFPNEEQAENRVDELEAAARAVSFRRH